MSNQIEYGPLLSGDLEALTLSELIAYFNRYQRCPLAAAEALKRIKTAAAALDTAGMPGLFSAVRAMERSGVN